MILPLDEALPDRLKIKIDTTEPIPASDLATFLSGAEGFFQYLIEIRRSRELRFFAAPDNWADYPAQLVVTRVEPGSFVFWLLPLVPEGVDLIRYMDTGLIVREYYRIIRDTIERFLDAGAAVPAKTTDTPMARLVRDFFKPVFAKSDASLKALFALCMGIDLARCS